MSYTREYTGRVYFLEAEMAGHPVKIGYTEGDPLARVADLQTGSPAKLSLLGTVPGDPALERGLHRRFAEHRIAGEWFNAKREVKRLLAGFARVEAHAQEEGEIPGLDPVLWLRFRTFG